jgi:hypothetical protein
VRVTGAEPGRPAAGPGESPRAFSEALERARRASEGVDRDRARRGEVARRAEALRGDDRLWAGRAESLGRADRMGSVAGGTSGAAVAPRMGRIGAPVAGAAAGGSGRSPGLPGATDPRLAGLASPELRSAARALPVAVRARGVAGGAPLELALGSALSVELRSGPDGVELLLRPDASLARAARAELPALVRALRARGVAVGRAEVRARRVAARSLTSSRASDTNGR